MDDIPWFDPRDCLDTRGEIWAEMFQAIRAGQEDYDGNLSPGQVLLVLEISINRDQHIEGRFRKRQELAIDFSRPTCFLNS